MSDADPRQFNLPALEALRPGQLDNVARALLSLTREVAVLADRVMVLEAVLAARGIPVSDAIDRFQPDAAFQARADSQMGRLLQSVLAAIEGGDGSDDFPA